MALIIFPSYEIIDCYFVSIFLLQPSIFDSLLEILNCTKIDNKTYIKSYLIESCESERYKSWIYFLVIPAFLFYVLIIPFSLFYFMAKNQKKLYHKDVMKYLGFSLNGLSKNKYYWFIYLYLII